MHRRLAAQARGVGAAQTEDVLERQEPKMMWPAVSTLGALLRRDGLVIARRKRRRVEP